MTNLTSSEPARESASQAVSGAGDPFEFDIQPRRCQVMGLSTTGFHKIAYAEWGDPDAERVALCVHGLTRQGRDFDQLARTLVQYGYRVVCPDLPGRGRSDRLVDPEEYALPQYALDMVTVIARLNVRAVDYVGTSLGGLIGMTIAGHQNAPIRRMVINDIGPFLPWAALARIGAYLRQAPRLFANMNAAEAYFRDTLAPYGDLSDAHWRHLTEHSVAGEPSGGFRLLTDPGIARAFRPVLFYNLRLWKYWDAIECPVLVLRGMESDLLPRDTALMMTRRGPRAELVEVPNCGHAPALLDPEQIGIVAKWLTART